MELGQSLRLREEPPDAALAVDTPDVASSGARSDDPKDPRKCLHKRFRHVFARHSPGRVEAEAGNSGLNDRSLLSWTIADAVIFHQHHPTFMPGLPEPDLVIRVAGKHVVMGDHTRVNLAKPQRHFVPA
jgi:hypothetical protein